MDIKVKFKGNIYYLIGDLTDAAIATKEAYENGKASFAHLFPNGNIMQFGRVIGNRNDLEVIGEEELEMKGNALSNLFVDPSWDE